LNWDSRFNATCRHSSLLTVHVQRLDSTAFYYKKQCLHCLASRGRCLRAGAVCLHHHPPFRGIWTCCHSICYKAAQCLSQTGCRTEMLKVPIFDRIGQSCKGLLVLNVCIICSALLIVKIIFVVTVLFTVFLPLW